MFKESYNTGEVHHNWGSANVCSIFEKGNIFEVVNYELVTLANITCTLMDHNVTINIMTIADQHKILNPLQHGLRKGLSCDTQQLNS